MRPLLSLLFALLSLFALSFAHAAPKQARPMAFHPEAERHEYDAPADDAQWTEAIVIIAAKPVPAPPVVRCTDRALVQGSGMVRTCEVTHGSR